MKDKILMIINEFPPVAESGVQRPLKFLKYMAKDDWETFVVTPKRLSKQITDETLLEEIPLSTKIFRTASWGVNPRVESNLTEARTILMSTEHHFKRLFWKIIKLLNDFVFPIDKQIGWVPFALFKSIKIIRKYKIRNVYITAYPNSAFIIGIGLKLFFGNKIFWVADYRDAWQFAPTLKSNVLNYRFNLICAVDDAVLKNADYVTFTSPLVRKQYTEKHPWLVSKSSTIFNGYDEDDFRDITPMSFDKYTFVYMGKIYTDKRNPVPLLQALKDFMSTDFQYLHVGTIGKQILLQIEKLNFPFHGYLGYKSHKEAIEYSAGANVNVIIKISDPEAEGAVPGKFFELLRIGKPILIIGPHQDFMAEVLAETKGGVSAKADDIDDIKRALAEITSEAFATNINSEAIERFSRSNLTMQLEAIYRN